MSTPAAFTVPFSLLTNGDTQPDIPGHLTVSGDQLTLRFTECTADGRRLNDFSCPTARVTNISFDHPSRMIGFVSMIPDGEFYADVAFSLRFLTDEAFEQVEAFFLTLPAARFQHELNIEAAFLQTLQQKGRAWVTLLLLAACLVVFVLMGFRGGVEAVFSPTTGLLLEFGANFEPMTVNGQWWRLLSSVFVHIGLLHIALNMFVLMQAGPLVERLFGSMLYLLIYLGAGLTGSLLSLLMNDSVVSAGASGAIFGIFGALVAYVLRCRRDIPARILKGLWNYASPFIGLNILFGFMYPGIDNYAHLGGLAGGFVFGLIAARPLHSQRNVFLSGLRATLIVLLAGLLFWGGLRVAQRKTPGPLTFINAYVTSEALFLAQWNTLTDDYSASRITPGEYAAKLKTQVLPVLEGFHRMSETIDVSKVAGREGTSYRYILALAETWLDACRKRIAGLEQDDAALLAEAEVLVAVTSFLHDHSEETGTPDIRRQFGELKKYAWFYGIYAANEGEIIARWNHYWSLYAEGGIDDATCADHVRDEIQSRLQSVAAASQKIHSADLPNEQLAFFDAQVAETELMIKACETFIAAMRTTDPQEKEDLLLASCHLVRQSNQQSVEPSRR